MGFQIEFLPENFLMDYRFSIYIGRKYLEIKITFFQKKTLLKKKSDITVKLKVGLALLSLLHYLKCISLVCILKVPYRINESEKNAKKMTFARNEK